MSFHLSGDESNTIMTRFYDEDRFEIHATRNIKVDEELLHVYKVGASKCEQVRASASKCEQVRASASKATRWHAVYWCPVWVCPWG